MLSRWPIRYKLLFGVAMLVFIVTVLSFSGFRGVYSFKELAKSIRVRAAELPLSQQLTQSVSDLRVTLSRVRRTHEVAPGPMQSVVDTQIMRQEFRTNLLAVNEALRRYRDQLDNNRPSDPRIGDYRRERETISKIEHSLRSISQLNRDEDWIFDDVKVIALDEELQTVQQLAGELPGYLQQRMFDFVGEARLQYRTWIALNWITSVSAVLMLALLVRLFYKWVFQPLRVLIAGSRQVAAGQFNHRIHVTTHDEVSELAAAMNDMTVRFQEIRDDLDRQVKQRTKEVVRSEQLASVGFLAAGVAHEINNPLASIAWCAESLESRMYDIMQTNEDDEEENSEIAVLRKYLRKIQDEAFRCKGITDRLLDYSRMGDVEKQHTQLGELVEGVIDMVRHLGKYREKHIEFVCDEPVAAPVNPQEIKQVVLNLITNALDSLDPGGRVIVQLSKTGRCAELFVSDDGCGMTDDVLEHLFEPFFTRRHDGQGTGLGLSITYRIVAEHGGTIEASSEGPGRGSRFHVTLPLEHHEKEYFRRLQVA